MRQGRVDKFKGRYVAHMTGFRKCQVVDTWHPNQVYKLTLVEGQGPCYEWGRARPSDVSQDESDSIRSEAGRHFNRRSYRGRLYRKDREAVAARRA